MAERRARIVPLLALSGALVLGGCASLPALDPPPYETPRPVEATPDPSPGDGFTEAEGVALRVWATACDAYRHGSAWMLDETHAITNRHVVDETSFIQLTDYQGNVYSATSAEYSETDDLAIVTIEGAFPRAATLAAEGPEPGDPLTVSGFALGGPLASLTGPYVGLRDNDLEPGGAQVYFVEVEAREGNSGSPLTNADGEVVGVVFSSDGERFAGAVTLARLRAFLEADAPRSEVDAPC